MATSFSSPIQYLDIDVTSAAVNPLPGGQGSTAAQRFVTRSGAIVSPASDFYIGVDSCRIPLASSIPLIAASPAPQQLPGYSGLTTSFVLGLTYNPTSVSPAPYMVKTNLILQKPSISVIPGDTQPAEYWYVPTMSDFLNMLNEALKVLTTAFNAVTASDPAISNPPYFSYAVTKGLLTFSCYDLDQFDQAGAAGSNFAEKILVWCNADLRYLLAGFDLAAASTLGGYTGGDADLAYYMQLVNDGYDWLGAPNPSGGLLPTLPTQTLMIVQERRSARLATGASRIQIRSSLSVQPEYSSPLTVSLLGRLENETVSGTISVLLDIEVDSLAAANGYIVLNSGGLSNTRWTKLTTVGAIQTIELSLWWIDRRGESHLMMMLAEPSHVKLAFVRCSILDNLFSVSGAVRGSECSSLRLSSR